MPPEKPNLPRRTKAVEDVLKKIRSGTGLLQQLSPEQVDALLKQSEAELKLEYEYREKESARRHQAREASAQRRHLKEMRSQVLEFSLTILALLILGGMYGVSMYLGKAEYADRLITHRDYLRRPFGWLQACGRHTKEARTRHGQQPVASRTAPRTFQGRAG